MAGITAIAAGAAFTPTAQADINNSSMRSFEAAARSNVHLLSAEEILELVGRSNRSGPACEDVQSAAVRPATGQPATPAQARPEDSGIASADQIAESQRKVAAARARLAANFGGMGVQPGAMPDMARALMDNTASRQKQAAAATPCVPSGNVADILSRLGNQEDLIQAAQLVTGRKSFTRHTRGAAPEAVMVNLNDGRESGRYMTVENVSPAEMVMVVSRDRVASSPYSSQVAAKIKSASSHVTEVEARRQQLGLTKGGYEK